MKKTMLLLTVLALLACLAACKDSDMPRRPFDGDARPDDGYQSISPSTEPMAEVPAETFLPTEPMPTEGPALRLEDQIALIAANYPLWVKSDPVVPYSFTVTDLDHNGRLEIISSVCMGTGFFSTNEIWEVNEKYDGLVLCTGEQDGNGSYSDLTTGPWTVIEKDGAYYYIVRDNVRNGYAFNAEDLRLMQLVDGQIIETLLAYRTTEVDGDYNETTQYFTADDTPITAEEYQAIHENGTFGGNAYSFMVGWTTLYADDIERMDEYEWQAVLTELWYVNEAGGGPF